MSTASEIVNFIIRTVAEYYQIPENEIRDGKSRVTFYTFPRQVALYFVGMYASGSQRALSIHFHRGHGTLAYAVRRVRGRSDTEWDVKRDLGELRLKIEDFILKLNDPTKPISTPTNR